MGTQAVIMDDWYKKEKINGRVYLMARPSGKHGDVQYNIASIFNSHFRKRKSKCTAKMEAQYDIDEDNYVIPDIMVFCYHRDKNLPMIVVEILSRWSRNNDLTVKMKKYAEVGIKEYWIVDWMHQTIDIYILNDDKVYDLYKSYFYFSEDDKELSKIPKIREEQKAELDIIDSFTPVSFPEITVRLEDVFYFVEPED
ncbi:MAG: Uma2 family endonuclease [Oscillospiraceae bacterium]|nr:Uma2 family endonuclease [Oscillospiraceae bacterium]